MDVADQLLATIRAAFAQGANATPEVKQAAADACRMLLAVLAPGASEAAATAPGAPPAPPATPTPTTRLDAILDLVVGKYGHLVPEDMRSTLRSDIPIISIPPNLGA